jgi:hypothetical protein
MKVLKSTQIAIGALLLGIGAVSGYRFYSDSQLNSFNPPPLKPGKLNIVGIQSKAYGIRISNDVAQLVERKGSSFDPGSKEDAGPMSGVDAKRIPMRELLQSLQGNKEALGRFIMVMNDAGETDDWPPIRNVWPADRLKRALDGSDPKLTEQLEQDLNMKLDGTPLQKFRMASYSNGIIVEVPVSVLINLGGKQTTLTGNVQSPYRPVFIQTLESKVKEKAGLTVQMLADTYGLLADTMLRGEKGEKVEGGVRRENIKASIEELLSTSRAERLSTRPQEVLQAAEVLVNDDLIVSASAKEEDASYDGKKRSYTITLQLTDEGRKRLWKYSRGRTGAQLLVINDGVAVAAPIIQHDLAQSELSITQLHDKNLVDEFVQAVNDLKSTRR